MGAGVSNKFLKSDKFLRSDREHVKNGVTVLGYTCHDVAKLIVLCNLWRSVMQFFVSVQATNSTYTKQNNCLTSMTGEKLQCMLQSHDLALPLHYAVLGLVFQQNDASDKLPKYPNPVDAIRK